jgi:gamma-glutamylcyclotransferase (GGCT)/AIG2-like uncharacterized protein YtfP
MAPQDCTQLFVYGSLRQGFNSPAYAYISQYFDLNAHGKIRGCLYDLGNYPAAIPTEEDKWITGELYTIRQADEFDWAIAQLDDYEGVDATEDESGYYARQLTEVKTNDGRLEKAWVYWFTGSTEGKPPIDSGDLLEYLAHRH